MFSFDDCRKTLAADIRAGKKVHEQIDDAIRLYDRPDFTPSRTALSTRRCSASQVASSAKPRNTFPLRETSCPWPFSICASARKPSTFSSKTNWSESKGSSRRESRMVDFEGARLNYSGKVNVRSFAPSFERFVKKVLVSGEFLHLAPAEA